MITGVRSRGARLRSTAFAYANLMPFIFFALFPFYFMLITSFKSNAELYSLKSIPLWIQKRVHTITLIVLKPVLPHQR